MIGVAEDDLRADLAQVARRHGLDRRARADRHEDRRLDRPVRRLQNAGPRRPVRVRQRETERPSHPATLSADPSGSSRAASTALVNHAVKRLRVGVIYGGRSGEHEVSLASAAAVIANLDRANTSRSRSASTRTAAGWSPSGRRTAMTAAETIEQARLGIRPPARRRARGAPGRAAERRDDAQPSTATAGGRSRRIAGARHRRRPRRHLPGAARPVRRGRHGPGPARTRQHPLCRLRRARLGGRHGQGDDEGRLRRARPADLRLRRGARERLAERIATA